MPVYFILNPGCNAVKIGYARNVRARFSAIQSANAAPLELLGVIHAGDDERFEARLHERYQSLHLRGEWFRAESRLMWYIEKHAGPPKTVSPLGVGISDESLRLALTK